MIVGPGLRVKKAVNAHCGDIYEAENFDGSRLATEIFAHRTGEKCHTGDHGEASRWKSSLDRVPGRKEKRENREAPVEPLSEKS